MFWFELRKSVFFFYKSFLELSISVQGSISSTCLRAALRSEISKAQDDSQVISRIKVDWLDVMLYFSQFALYAVRSSLIKLTQDVRFVKDKNAPPKKFIISINIIVGRLCTRFLGYQLPLPLLQQQHNISRISGVTLNICRYSYLDSSPIR